MIRGLAGLLLAAGLALAAPVPTHLMPKGDPICYPLRVGDKCIHQLGEGELVAIVTRVDKGEAGTSVTMNVTDSTRNSSYSQTVIVSDKGVRVTEYAGQKIDPPVWWLKLPHGPKNTWTGSWP